MRGFKAWRPLNLAGFVFTFVIGTVCVAREMGENAPR
jgi:uncharacterized membrane protein